MYRDLGFIRVWGAPGGRPGRARRGRAASPTPTSIYPHKPIVAYLPQTGRLLNEYCVEFPDETRPYGSPRLPDSDDVLAKWMALTGDERAPDREANMHLPGRQVDPRQVRRDLWRLGRWERERLARAERARRRGAARRARRRLSVAAVMDARQRSTPSTAVPRADRGPRARRRARLPPRHRLRRRGPGQADHRRRHHLDRDDAVQLPPARARREGQGGHPRGRRHADGVQHDRHLRRHHDGHRGDEDLARLAARSIADSIELVARGHLFDARRRAGGLRQDDPRRRDGAGAARRPRRDALRRLDRARPLSRATTSRSRTSSRPSARTPPARSPTSELHELEDAACPGAGACGGQFTANTMAMAFEVLGISPMGRAMVPAEDSSARTGSPSEAGELVMDVLARGSAPARHHHARGARERDRRRRRPAAARPTPCCTCSRVAREAGVDARRSTTSTAISARDADCSCDLKPGGRYVAADLYERRRHRRSSPSACSRPGCCTTDAQTVTGRTIGERRRARRSRDARPGGRAAARRPAQADRRPGDPARQPRARGLRRQGRRATSARTTAGRRACSSARRTRWRPSPPAQIKRRRRRRDPQRGPGGRPGHARDARGHRARSSARGSASRSRCSPTAASPAPPAASWPATSRPRRSRAARSPRSATATRSRSTSTAGGMDVELSDDEIAAPASRAYEAAAARTTRNGVMAKYARSCPQRLRGRDHALSALDVAPPASRSPAEELGEQLVEARSGRSIIGTWPVSSKIDACARCRRSAARSASASATGTSMSLPPHTISAGISISASRSRKE